jgi:hypothetical protein
MNECESALEYMIIEHQIPPSHLSILAMNKTPIAPMFLGNKLLIRITPDSRLKKSKKESIPQCYDPFGMLNSMTLKSYEKGLLQALR